MSDPAADLDRFYRLLSRLEHAIGGTRTLAECHGRLGWPARGMYFFFEPGEIRGDGNPRVTRVGTHALTATSKATLWGRLAQHRGRGDGGGNHAGRPGSHTAVVGLDDERVSANYWEKPTTETMGVSGGVEPREPLKSRLEKLKTPPSEPSMR
jgi:hypothetical protein